jgi:hypothetical protein
MKHLIGSTGLIGQTISKQIDFDYLFDSKKFNYFDNFFTDGDSIFLSCLPATKWLVNKNLKEDMDNIYKIINILKNKEYDEIILISTIDVYNDSPYDSDEKYNPNISKLSYGNNRYLFELMVKEFLNYKTLKIFRLPALYNNLIKKNVIYDLLNNNNINQINSNSYFQWYNLDNLHNDIENYKINFPNYITFNLFTEPLHTKLIIEQFPEYIDIVKNDDLIKYDYKTIFNSNGYIDNKENVLNNIKNFINEYSNK